MHPLAAIHRLMSLDLTAMASGGGGGLTAKGSTDTTAAPYVAMLRFSNLSG